jgi:hypothetical protein
MTKKIPATMRNMAIAKKSNQRRTSMLGSSWRRDRQPIQRSASDSIGPVQPHGHFGLTALEFAA